MILLGLPLKHALALMAKENLPEPQIVLASPVKGIREEGTLRVVAVNADLSVLTVARFMDGMPEIADARA